MEEMTMRGYRYQPPVKWPLPDHQVRVAMVNGTPWKLSEDERFIHAPWGEGKLGPKGKANLSDPDREYLYAVVDYSAAAWGALVAAYLFVRDLEPDGPRSAGRLEKNLTESKEDPAVIAKAREIITSGYRPELQSSLGC